MGWVSQQLPTNKTVHRGYGGGREEGRRGIKEGRGTAQLRTVRLKGMRACRTLVGTQLLCSPAICTHTSVVGEGDLGHSS